MKFVNTKIVFVIVLIFLCCSHTGIYAAGITSEVSIENNIAIINGRIDGVGRSTRVTLLVGGIEKIEYVDEIDSHSDGTFTFIVPFNDSTPKGQYPYKIGSSARVGNSEGIINYVGQTIDALNHFMSADFTLSVNNYVPSISGTVSCKQDKIIRIVATNITDNSVIAEETIDAENGMCEILYTLPSLISPKNYSIMISAVDNEKEQMLLNVEIDSSIVLVEINGNIEVDDKTYVDMQVKSDGSDLINKSTTINSDRSVSITIPNLLMNAVVELKADGYEKIKIVEDDVEFKFNTNTFRDVSFINLTGNVEPAYCMNMRAELIEPLGDVVSNVDFKSDTNGEYSCKFSLGDNVQTGLYTVKVYITDDIFAVDEVYIMEPIEKIELKKSTNEKLYSALKKARPSLDSDENGVITVEELETISGTLDISNCNIDSIDGLQGCIGIKELYLNDNKITNLDKIADLSKLDKLIADGNCLETVNILPKNLKFLDLSHNNITNLNCVRYMEELKYLFASNNNISNISFLEKLKNLEYLSLSSNSISDMQGIENCSKIKHLDMSYNYLDNIGDLTSLGNLTNVFFDGNQITNLEGLPNLWYRNLHFKYNQISPKQISQFFAINKSY